MAEHKVPKKDIIYIIPNDELYLKYINDEAFIDDYGRLMNRKPHRVLKELKHYAVKKTIDQQQYSNVPVVPYRKKSSGVKELLRYKAEEATQEFAHYAIDKLLYEIVPKAWHNYVVPAFHDIKESFNTKEKDNRVLAHEKKNTEIAKSQKDGVKMTQEEINFEKRKVLYHWIGMLSSLKKLNDAGEIEINSVLSQLTDPMMLERVNGLLSENPNLLETDKYIALHSLMGRDLYEDQRLIPIRAEEIENIAETYGYRTKILGE